MPTWNSAGKNDASHYAVVDPGSSHLRVLSVGVSGEEATVWGWDQVAGLGGGSAHRRELARAFEKALARSEDMARNIAGSPFEADKLMVGLPGALLRGRAWTVELKRARPDVPVEEQELAGLMARGLRLAVNRLAGSEEDWLLIDAGAVSLTVDGRGVTDPVGFRGAELGATVFAALARRETVELWRDVAAAHRFSTLILAVTPMAMSARCPESQCVMLDAGGRTTDVTWTRGRLPIALESVPRGGAALSESLLEKWDISSSKAEQLKRACAEGRLSEDASYQVLEAMAPALQGWLREIERVLAKLQGAMEQPIPDRLYLLGGASSLPELLEVVRSLAWSRRLTFARYPEIVCMRPWQVAGVINRTELGRKAGDGPALACAAWTASLHSQRGRPGQVLREQCGLLRA